MNTAKGWLVWYYRVKDSHGAPAFSFIDSTGRLYAKECSKCRNRHRHARKDNSWACGHCGQDWPYEDRYILKGEIQRSARFDGMEMRNARQFDVGRIVHRLLIDHREPGHLYVANCMGVSIRRLADAGAEFWPTWGFSWKRSSVHNAIQRGAQLWEESLDRADIPFTRF